MMITQLFLFLLLGVGDEAQRCREHTAVVGKCYVVHGRLRTYNGNPTFRISPAGSKRILGVTGPQPGGEPVMPKGITCDFAFDCDVLGDFEVCPFTKQKTGVTQRVCLAGVKNRTVVERNRNK